MDDYDAIKETIYHYFEGYQTKNRARLERAFLDQGAVQRRAVRRIKVFQRVGFSMPKHAAVMARHGRLGKHDVVVGGAADRHFVGFDLELRAGFAFAPNVYVAVALNCLISASLAVIGPGVLAALSLAIPPRARATGFAIGSLWVIPGLAILPVCCHGAVGRPGGLRSRQDARARRHPP